jgi:UDP:flavonoid glycosyltransferase YjiC (YdhE family)
MKALVTVMPIAGHVAPVTGVVAELLRRGHEVTVYTGSRYCTRFADLGAKVVPWSAAADFNEDDLAGAAAGPLGVFRLMAMIKEVFLLTGNGQVQDLARELDRSPADVVVGDVLSIGAGLVGEVRGIPWAGINALPFNLPGKDLPPPGFGVPLARGRLGRVRDRVLWAAYRALTFGYKRAYNDVRTGLGLPRDSEPYGVSLMSGSLVLATGCPSLEQPRTDLPPQVHFVGRLAPAGGAELQRPPTPAPDRPRVVVTQGTHNLDPTDLIQPALTGLADLKVDVIATTGRRGETEVGITVPENARVVDFLDFDSAFADTAVFITNGGWGGVLHGLSAGVPLVVAGGDIDKPENAARVARSGAGINLRTGRPKPDAVAAAVCRVLADPGYADRARQIGAELDHLGGVGVAVDLLERLAETGAPVRRMADPWFGR